MPAAVFDKPTGNVTKPATVKQALPAVFVAAFAAFGGILYGYDTGVISGLLTMQPFLQQYATYYPDGSPTDSTITTPDYYLTTGQTSLVTSILSAGTFVGALCGAPLGDLLGRRWGLQVVLAVFCIGVILQMVSTSLTLFIIGRVVAGLGIGGISTLIVLYQSEVAPRWIRGAVVSAYQWCITIGLLLAAIVENSSKDYNGQAAYHLPIGLQFAFAVILSVGLFFLPESPRWLIKVGKTDRAAKALARLNSSDQDDPIVRSELADIQTALDFERTYAKGTYLDLFKGGERKVLLRVLTGTGLQAMQQLTGINFIFYYGTRFFASTGSSNAYLFTIASNVVNVIMTIPSFFLMERVGRRWMLIGGALYMAVCELIVASLGTAYGSSNPSAQRALVAFVCLYVAGFAATWGPAAWVVCGEIFGLDIRAKALSLCTASNWLWNFGIGYATPYLVDTGPGNAGLQSKVFWIWTGTCFLCAVYAFFLIYETKGLSLEQVDRLYMETTAFKSRSANAAMKRADMEYGVGAKPADDEAVTADAAKHSTMAGTKDASHEDVKEM